MSELQPKVLGIGLGGLVFLSKAAQRFLARCWIHLGCASGSGSLELLPENILLKVWLTFPDNLLKVSGA